MDERGILGKVYRPYQNSGTQAGHKRPYVLWDLSESTNYFLTDFIEFYCLFCDSIRLYDICNLWVVVIMLVWHIFIQVLDVDQSSQEALVNFLRKAVGVS